MKPGTVAAIVAWLALGGLAACTRQEPGLPADPEVLAIYAGGRITAADVDRAVLAMPIDQGRLAEKKTADWYQRLIRRMVVDRLLLAEAELIGIGEDPQFVAVHEESRRQVILEAYLAANRRRAEPVTEEDLRRYYEEHREDYTQSERRHVFHLFRRRQPGVAIDGLKEELAELRRRVLRGESFAGLAKEHSESESRHRDGSLGWIDRGEMSPDLDRVIFALEEGVPGEPVTTAEGVHLFMVEKAIEEKLYAFDEVEVLIGRQLQKQRRDQALDRLVADLPLPAGSFVPEPPELASLLRAGDPRAVVLRIGDYEMRLERFRAMLAEQQAAAGAQAPADLPLQLLRFVERRERIYLHATAEGLDEQPEVAARLALAADSDLALFQGRRSLERKLSRETERLQTYHEHNKMRFASPVRLRLRRLAVPLATVGDNAVMTRLEQARAELDQGTLDLAAVAAELGGTIADLDWLTLPEVARLGPGALRLVADLEAGEHSPPYRTQSSLELLAVIERREPEPLPLASVLDRVRAGYLEDHRQQLHREWMEEVLTEAELEVYRDRLEGLATRQLPERGTPAEEIEPGA